MLKKTYIHMLLNNSASNSRHLCAYSKTIFLKGSKSPGAKKGPEKKEELRKIEKEYKKLKKALRSTAKYSDTLQQAKKIEGKNVQIKNTRDIDTKIIDKISNSFPIKYRKKINGHLGEALRNELSKTVNGQRGYEYMRLLKASPVNFDFQYGTLRIENSKGYQFDLDLYELVPMLKDIDRLSKIKRKIEALKKGVKIKSKEKRKQFAENIDLSPNFGKLHKSMLEKHPSLKEKCKITKKGKDYELRFIGKNWKERRKNELQLKIHDIFDFGLLEQYEDSSVRIRVYNPKLGVVHYATWHPGYKSFIIDGTTKRLLVYNRARIRVLEFKIRPKTKSKKTSDVDKRPAKQIEEKTKLRKAALKERDKQAEFEREQRKDRLFHKYYKYIFRKDHFWNNKLLQDDKHFKHWDQLSIVLERVLADEPFKIGSPTQQKLYIQKVVQAGRNAEIQGYDFFKYRNIYKGGYDQFIKDYKRLSKKYDKLNGKLTEKELDQLEKIENIALGIARIYEALENLKPLKESKESNRDILNRTVFLNAQKAEARDLKEVNKANYRVYPLSTLVHNEELSSNKISILVPENVERRLMQDVLSAYSDLPSDMKRPADLAFAKENPARFLMHTFGLEFLIKQGAIRKVGKDRYVLSRTPKKVREAKIKGTKKFKTIVDTDFWAFTAFQYLSRAGEAKTANAKQWEAVRSQFDAHHKALYFIEKIFKSDKTTVANNLKSGWSRLWHWEWAKKKYVTMSSLNKKSYGRNDFELEAVERRGYLDLKGAVQERFKNTGMYEIPKKNHDKLLTLVNDYLAKGIEMTLRNAPKGKQASMLVKLRRTFAVGELPFKKPYMENINHNVSLLINEMGIKKLNPSLLSRNHIRFIRLGFLEERYLKTIKNVDMKEQYFSNDPKIRQVQRHFRDKGLPLHMLPRVEVDFKAGIGALINSDKKVGVGGAVGFTMRYKRPNGDIIAGSLSIGGLEKGAVVSAAIKYAIKHKHGRISFSAGTYGGGSKEIGGLGGATLGVSFDFNIKGTGGKISLGARAGVGVGGTTGFHWGVAVFAGYGWEQGRALKAQKEKALKKYNDVFKITGFNAEKMRLIRNHPDPNIKALVRYADLLFKKTGKPCPDKVLYLLWKRKVSQIKRAVERKQKLPWIKNLGAFFGVGGSAMTPIAFGGGLYITFKVPGTDEVIAVRQVAGRFNQFRQEAAASAEIRRKLKASKVTMSEFELKGQSALVYYDARMGGTGLARVGLLEKSQDAEIAADTSFLQIQKIFKNLDIDAKLVPADPKNPKKGKLIQITPLDIEGSNVEIQIDPDLVKKGLILDSKSDPQRILLTASAVKLLMVTRKRIKFPFHNKGGMNLDIITFKDRSDRDTNQIRNESPQYIYKKRGAKYEIVNSENVRDIDENRKNVMTLAEYKARVSKKPGRYEKFKNTPLINLRENRRLTVELSKALRVKSAKEFTYQKGNAKRIPMFAKEWYKIKLNKRFLTRTLNSGNPLAEAKAKTKLFMRLKSDFKKIYKVELNDFELNTMYSILINEHFTYLPRQKGKEKRINRLLKFRNELFRKYMVRYVMRWRKKYPNEWKKIRKIHKVTPYSIANFLFLSMPQNFEQLSKRLKGKQVEITKYMKFLSYSQRGYGETMPTVYGASNPAGISKFFKLFGPTALKLNAINKKQRAIAHTVFGMLSPLDTREKLKLTSQKVSFLNSELPLMLISLYDPIKKLSPMIEVLGKKDFKNMVKIYKLARAKDVKGLKKLLNNKEVNQSFEEFRALTLKVRAAQLAGKKMVKQGEFVIHMSTKVMVGPYLKCGNGTILARQRFRITTKKRLRTAWAGARAERNVLVNGKYRKVAKYLTLAAGVVVTTGAKGETPDVEDEKGETGDVTPSGQTGSMGGELQAPDGTQTPSETGRSGSMG